MDENDIKDMMSRRPQNEPIKFKTVEQGAATTVWAATAPELEGRGGFYCEDCHIAERTEVEGAAHGVLPWALDPKAADRLWTLSEEWSGEKFPA
jgi:predicted RNA-binding protein YlxR (DUF448 family)